MDGKPVVFSRSQLIPSTNRISEGEVLSYELSVRYDGDEDSQPVTVVFRIPYPAMVVSSSPSMIWSDEYQRELTWSGEISPNSTREFTFTLVTLPDSARSGLLIASAGILWRRQGAEWQTDSLWLQNEIEIHSKSGQPMLTFPNGMTVGKAGIVLLGYLILGPLLVIYLPHAIRRRATRRQEAGQTTENVNMFVLYLHGKFVLILQGSGT